MHLSNLKYYCFIFFQFLPLAFIGIFHSIKFSSFFLKQFLNYYYICGLATITVHIFNHCHLFIHPFNYLFIHSFIHSFIHLFICHPQFFYFLRFFKIKSQKFLLFFFLTYQLYITLSF